MSRSDKPRPGARHAGRECALQVLYQLDATSSTDAAEALALYWSSHFAWGEAEGVSVEEVRPFAEALVTGTMAKLSEIDQTLQRSTQHWRLSRMARVDRNVLRLATFELLYSEDVPARVALNEAIELAKRFGSEESGAFVNGILDRIAHEAGRR